jgi:hypothetical protein
MALAAKTINAVRELFGTPHDRNPALWLFRVQTVYRDARSAWYWPGTKST